MGRKWKKCLCLGVAAALIAALPITARASGETEYGGASELTDGTAVTPVAGLAETSPDGTLEVKIMTDSDAGRFYYTVSKNGKTILQASQLGLAAEDDFTQGLAYVEGSLETGGGTEEYTLTGGAKKAVEDPYREMSFALQKKDDGEKRVLVTLRLFNGGIAYRYTLFGKTGETVKITGEASEYVLPTDAVLWAGNTDPNYEFEFSRRTMSAVKSMSGDLSVPLLASAGGLWVLISEGAVYNDPDPYCASFLSTQSGSRNLRVAFGNAQNGPVEKTFKENGTVSTPWRVAAIADNLNDIVNATVFTSVNPDPDPALYGDTSYIRPGKAAWSWWSESGDDPVEYDQQKDYIDFAAKNGWEYVCIDFGWCLWEDYQTKVKELVEYAEARGVGIMLWYGVNNDNHAGFKDAAGSPAYPKYSLKTAQQLEEQFSWCESVGVRAVKVDYYERDDQFTMRQMYDCATIAAKHHINVLFHGCTVPRGEQRTFPNVLGYEAIRGAEWYKWNVGPSIATDLISLFTRNVLGGMDYTPPAMQIDQLPTTAGFRLAQTVAYESGLPSFASSVFKLEGFEGLALLNDLPVSWDETLLLDGYPGEHLEVARRSGEDWYLAAMTLTDRTEKLSLSFLGDGTYTAYIFRDNEDGDGIELETRTVTKNDVLTAELLYGGGMAVKLTKSGMALETPYDGYDFYEAEDRANQLGGSVSVVKNQFVSGMRRVAGIGSGGENTLTFTNVTAPEDGVYELRLYFSCGVERRICISVNGGEPIRSEKLNCGVNALSAKSFYVELKAGVNTVTFSNPQAKAPDVDRIAVSKSPVDMEPTKTDDTDDGVGSVDGAQYEYDLYGADKAAFAGGARLENGGIGWLGNSPSCTATFTVTVSEAGRYKLRVGYYTGETRDLQIKAGDETQTVTCPSTGSYTSESTDYVYVDVELKAGENELTLLNDAGWAPNILEIGVSKVRTDTPEATETPTEEEDPAPEREDERSGIAWIVAAAVLGVGAVIGVAAAICKKRGKKHEK